MISNAMNPAQASAPGLVLPRPFPGEFTGISGAVGHLAKMPPLMWLWLLTLVLLLPFVGKAFFIDDTLFVRAAQQIQKHPLDFYGFNINWHGYPTPMTVAMDNPPLTSYYLALVASFFGWSEWSLHLAFLLPALAAIWGTFTLARNYCERPFLASLMVLLAPVFLISATSVMCDVSQLAFWVWSVFFFDKGLRTETRLSFVASGLLAGLAFLTKYLGLSLVPLLLAYGICRKRRPGWWLVAPVIPLFFAAGYEWLTYTLYGHGLLFSAAQDAAILRTGHYEIPWEKAIVGLSFVGACFLSAFLYAPWLWTRRMLLGIPCLVAALLLIIPRMAMYNRLIWPADEAFRWDMFFYIAALVVAGLYLFLLAGMDLWERRDAVSLLLFLWLAGMFVFTVAVNWTIDGRSLLPALPAVGILAARRLDKKYPTPEPGHFWRFSAPAFLSAVISLLLVQADCGMADNLRATAIHLGAKYRLPGKTTWFSDHWGFQYYIEPLGANAVDYKAPKYSPGDILIVTYNARNFRCEDFSSNPPNQLRLIETGEITGKEVVSTIDPGAGAGFYSTSVGTLPFAIGDIQPQLFKVCAVVKAGGTLQSKPNPSAPAAD